MLATLPLELYRPILEHLKFSELRTLTTVSRVLQIEVERIIHRRKTIEGPPRNIVQKCRFLLATPRFLPLILDLWLQLDGLRIVPTLSYRYLVRHCLQAS
jgi:hypothetical protein